MPDERDECALELLFYEEERRAIIAAYEEAQSRLRMTMACRAMGETAGHSLQARVVALARHTRERARPSAREQNLAHVK